MSDQPLDPVSEQKADEVTAAPPPARPLQPRRSRKLWVAENVLSLLVALLLVFMIRSSVIEAFKIPSGSMIPTLMIGDHIFVNKFSYGVKVPFSDFRTTTPIYLMKRDPPRHGDVIVFIYPKDENFYYIKRVIGVPGDTIEIKNKLLYINQQLVKRDPVSPDVAAKIFKDINDPKYSANNLEIYSEHLDHHDHLIMVDKNNFLGESYGPITVPPDSLFVMGDNRDFSNDSRFWGFVPMKNVKGKAELVWLSVWANLTDSQFVFRPGRIGTLIR